MDYGANGAFYRIASHTGVGSTGAAISYKECFNASRCSSIYGSSNTVQPNALTARYYIKF